MKTIIHVKQDAIRRNMKTGSRDPAIIARNYKGLQYGHDVVIHGPSRVVYSPDKPLKCGARVWIETESEVEVIG